MEVEEISNRISAVSNTLLNEKISSNKEWTKAIFESLTEYAYENNKRIWSHPNNIDHTINEWLYDLVIFDGETPTDISEILVTLESEWNSSFDEIKYDFYKLIQSRSNLRVMIFQANNVSDTTEKLVKLLEFSNIAQTGDQYLFACWNDSSGFYMLPYVKS